MYVGGPPVTTPLTISAEGQSYTLPTLKVPRRRAHLQKIC